MIAVIDGCSLCYASGHAADIKEAEFALDNYVKEIVNATQCERFIGFVEAPENKNIFRFHVAVSKPYKSGRKGRQKPPFVKEMKRLAKHKYGFQYCHNVEAEDALLVTANKIGIDKVIMCSVDKDTRQQHGTFFDYFKKEFVTITPEQAHYNLWKQVLTGDSVDSIPGIPGVGDKKAIDFLASAPVDHIPFIAAQVYKARSLSYEYFLEQCRLIYILRSRTDLFTPITREQWEEL